MRLWQKKEATSIRYSTPLSTVETNETTVRAQLDALQDSIEDYLDQVSALLISALPFTARRELRREVRLHLEALVAAFLEMGESPTAARDKAFQQFGTPEEVAASLRQEAMRNRPWHRLRSWWSTPRFSLGTTLPVLVLIGLAFVGSTQPKTTTPMLSQPPKSEAMAESGPTMTAAAPFHHSAHMRTPCTDCHRDVLPAQATQKEMRQLTPSISRIKQLEF